MGMSVSVSKGCICEIYLWICRTFGVFTAVDLISGSKLGISHVYKIALIGGCWILIVRMLRLVPSVGMEGSGLWGVGLETLYYGNVLWIYLISIAMLASFFELLFLVQIWIGLCIKNEQSRCTRCFDWLSWLDNWKKCILYLLASIGCFTHPLQVWLAIIPGSMLIVCGILYLLKTFKDRPITKHGAQEVTFQRFTSFEADIENDLDAGSISTSAYSIANQEEILEV